MVFGGNDVRDQSAEAALFQDLASSPATVEASNICDMFSLLEDRAALQADAVSAYTQAKVGSKSLGAVATACLAGRWAMGAYP